MNTENNDEQRIRCFIALPIPQKVKESMEQLQRDLDRRGWGVRWVPPENLHITLKFLGNVDPKLICPLLEGLEEIARRTDPFETCLEGIGVFPNLKQPRVLWVGMTRGADALRALAEEVSRMVNRFSTEADNKPFRPHLTIARFKKRLKERLSIPSELLEGQYGNIPCDRVLFMKSELGARGARHETLSEAVLNEP